MRHVAMAAAAALLSACAAMTPGTEDASANADACGAGGLQSLVGTSVGALDPATLPEPRRILFSGQAATQDLRPDRLNVQIGDDDAVARVYCG